eukprot:scaffold56752_cov66-Phaeocystis_antarctica.AAC.4
MRCVCVCVCACARSSRARARACSRRRVRDIARQLAGKRSTERRPMPLGGHRAPPWAGVHLVFARGPVADVCERRHPVSGNAAAQAHQLKVEGVHQRCVVRLRCVAVHDGGQRAAVVDKVQYCTTAEVGQVGHAAIARIVYRNGCHELRLHNVCLLIWPKESVEPERQHEGGHEVPTVWHYDIYAKDGMRPAFARHV